jgi:hypothetical protein
VFNDNTLDVPLGATDDLTIGISLMDWDQHSADDFVCEGSLSVDHANVVVGHTGFVLCRAGDPPEDIVRLDFEITNVF